MRLSTEDKITVEQLIDIYRRSGIRRPVDDGQRMQKMLENANLIVSAWDGNNLIGVARCFADYGWVCYLSDLAVDELHQKRGVGRAIVQAVRDYVGPQCQLVLLSAPEAMEYYPKIGFERAHHAFILRRAKP